MEIKTYWDLLNYFPFRYEDYSLISKINALQEGETCTVIGEIVEAKYEFTKRGLKIQKVRLSDGTGLIDLAWYNQPYLLRLFKPGIKLAVSGAVKSFGNKLIMDPQEYEILTGEQMIHTGRLVPIYPEKKGLSSKTLREKIHYTLNQLILNKELVADPLPEEIIKFNDLLSENESYQNIHFPKSRSLEAKARGRLAFSELFTIQLASNIIRREWNREKVANKIILDAAKDKKILSLVKSLPFELTDSQKKVISEILKDLQSSQPMNRFLQGDVGSGKTVVAAIACYLSTLNGYQSLFMAPTEILASQHYKTINELFKYTLRVSLVTGSLKSDKEALKADIVIGTQALIQKKISFEKVGLVIVDEQHRFGVVQRTLLKKKGFNPHLLTMTATPIPRTVALTIYGELDMSVIDEMPKGRLPVKTYLVPLIKREDGYRWISEQIKLKKSQVFIVCPFIEESEVETMKSVKAATVEFDRLRNRVFQPYRLGLLHGKMRSKEKDFVMNQFKNGELDILVSTPVVEVGIDIPNATIMLIEGSERFGLAQLHQLRGRVGRSDKQSYCFLFSEIKDKAVEDRLTFFSKNQSGVELAEYDLKRRGPGEIFGTRQHGYVDLKIASLSDYALISKTKKAVLYFTKHFANFSKFKVLKRRAEEYNITQISRD